MYTYTILCKTILHADITWSELVSLTHARTHARTQTDSLWAHGLWQVKLLQTAAFGLQGLLGLHCSGSVFPTALMKRTRHLTGTLQFPDSCLSVTPQRERERESVCVCVCMCMCVCVCVRVHVCTFLVTYEDTNLYNDMGMTGITRRRWFLRTFPHVPVIQKT